ncbi:hypothetical protein P3X46_014089 [Hevea brasiliensis]|uniref:Uncharacterized protein n=1 Tax=Hevea brasiliensis TaxID=3981 RepID=A0ABQ9M7B1_HEVBR|nr:hypothetical protein P3X46_014089 [Hevea brasiliensis]
MARNQKLCFFLLPLLHFCTNFSTSFATKSAPAPAPDVTKPAPHSAPAPAPERGGIVIGTLAGTGMLAFGGFMYRTRRNNIRRARLG